jgi:Flp pilus assembly protein TadG
MLNRLLRCDRAGSAAEFALVLPLLLIFLFGIIDGGRFLWEFNRAEKATQMGVRYAVVTDPVLSGLSSYDFATSSDAIPQGSAIPTANFTSAVCTSSGCTCSPSAAAFCAATSLNSTALGNLATRMKHMYPPITTANVEVDYKNVGLGFAGDPVASDVSPLVTVKLSGLVFRPVTCLMFACSITMPDFRATLTAEDLSGSDSN